MVQEHGGRRKIHVWRIATAIITAIFMVATGVYALFQLDDRWNQGAALATIEIKLEKVIEYLLDDMKMNKHKEVEE